MPAAKKRSRRGSVGEPTPLKPDASLLSPITPREVEPAADAATADAASFRAPPPPTRKGGRKAKAPKVEKKQAKKSKKKAPAKKAAASKSRKKQNKRAPVADDSDSDDDLSLDDLKRKPASPSAGEPSAKKPALVAPPATAEREFEVGAAVVLAPGVSITGSHVLEGGEQGVVLEVEADPEDDEPYKVVSKSGATYWYEVGHLAAAPAAASGEAEESGQQGAGEEPGHIQQHEQQQPEAAADAQPPPAEEAAMETRLLDLADDDESEEEAETSPARKRRQAPPVDSDDDDEDDGEAGNDVAATLTYSPADSGENEQEDEPAKPSAYEDPDQTWELVNTWVTIEFDAVKDKKQGKEWHDCLVVDYDRATSQHLVKWADDGKEEWLPALKPGEFEPAESQAKQKCKEVVFDNNVKLPPVEKPELVGCTFKVIKPVKVNAGQARESSQVGTCKPGEIIKVLKACELNGQLRVMYHRGWTSAASRKGAKFLQKTKSILHIMKEDKRAMRKVEKRAKEEEERQARDHLELHKASVSLTTSWVAACAKAELRSQKQTAAAAAAFNGGGAGGESAGQDQWRKKRRIALTGADESDAEDEDEVVTQEEAEDLYNKVKGAEQKAAAAAAASAMDSPTAAGASTAASAQEAPAPAPKLTGLQALFAKRAASAAVLQSVIRAAELRRKFLARREAALGIQALVRGMLARDDVFEIRMDLIAELKAANAKKVADAKAVKAAAKALKAKEIAEAEAKAAAEAELAAAAEIDWGAEGLDDDAFSPTPSQQQQQQQQPQQQPPQQQAGADAAADGIDWNAVDLEQMEQLATTQKQQANAAAAPAPQSTGQELDDDMWANMDDSALAALEQGATSAGTSQ
jgi:hypothetical protein